MKKVFLLAIALLALPLTLAAADRVVVLEIVTGTWCYYCPAAANGAEDLVQEHPGEVLVVEHHSGGSDPFANSDASNRQSLYSITGVPTAMFDGVEKVVGGGHTGSTFFTYNGYWNLRHNIDSPLEITMTREYTGYMSTGTVTATITNVSEETISGKVHFTTTESDIDYSWQGLDKLHFVQRDMMPDAGGESITIPPGEEVVVERDFSTEGWNNATGDDGNVELGCFVQSSDPLYREIYQGAFINLANPPVGAEETEPLFSLTLPDVVTDYGSVKLVLDRPAPASVKLFNAAGREVKIIHRASLSAGVHELDFATGDLAAGAYFITAEVEGRRQTGKLLVLK